LSDWSCFVLAGGPFDRCGDEPVVDRCIAHVVATFVRCWRVRLAELSASLQRAGFVGLPGERGGDGSVRIRFEASRLFAEAHTGALVDDDLWIGWQKPPQRQADQSNLDTCHRHDKRVAGILATVPRRRRATSPS
jgi:hypothetical protein